MDEAEIISELYALPLADFTRVRNDIAAQAKTRGRGKIVGKPTARAGYSAKT